MIDGLIGRLMKVNECVFILRNAFYFISTPFVLLAYSFVELYALHEMVILGKKVCKHSASVKSALNSGLYLLSSKLNQPSLTFIRQSIFEFLKFVLSVIPILFEFPSAVNKLRNDCNMK